MAAIVTFTCSPVVDKSTRVPALAPEKKLRCAPPVFEPGGGGINVARAIRQLGGSATALYPSGGHAGKLLEELLSGQGVPSKAIPVAATTRENFIVLEEATNNQYRFGMPAAPLRPEEWQACLAAIRAEANMEYLVVSGSMPEDTPGDLFAQLGAIAHQKGARLVIDTTGPSLLAAARAGVYLMKPNLSELSALVGRTEIHLEKVDDVARELIGKGGSALVAVSLGPGGAALVSSDEVVLVSPPPVSRQSTVGAGDSMVAGMILALSEGRNLVDVARLGVAAGTAATMNPGTALCQREDVDRLLPLLQVQVLRHI